MASAALGPSLTVVTRPGGGTQLAYAGHPLYAFTVEGPHEMSGNGVSDRFGGTTFQWSAATTSGHAHAARPARGSMSAGTGGHGYGY
jgi:hypothetical protein